MDFGKVMNKAWEVFTKFKVLWIFGILASCAGPAVPSFPVAPITPVTYTSEFPEFDRETGEPILPPEVEQFLQQFIELMDENPEQFMGMFLTFFAIAFVFGLAMQLVFFVIRQFGRVGIIQGVLGAESQSEAMRFGDLFSASLPFMWRALGLNFVVWLVLFVAFLGLFLGFAFGAGATGGLLALCIFPLICLFFIGTILVNGWLEIANNALVVDNLGIVDAWQKGWAVFRRNFGNIILLILFMMVVFGIIWVIMMIPSGIVANIAFSVIQSGNDADLFKMMQSTWWLGYVSMFISLVGLGIARTYTGSLWTLAYLEFSAADAAEAVIDEDMPEKGEGKAEEK